MQATFEISVWPEYKNILLNDGSPKEVILGALEYFKMFFIQLRKQEVELVGVEDLIAELLQSTISIWKKYSNGTEEVEKSISIDSLLLQNFIMLLALPNENCNYFIEKGVVENHVEIFENFHNEPRFNTAIRGLTSLAKRENFLQIFANGIWERLFQFLPEKLPETGLPPKAASLIDLYKNISGQINTNSQYFNAVLERIANYLLNWNSNIPESQLQRICNCLLNYLCDDGNRESNLPLPEIIEKLLEIRQGVKEEDTILQMYSLLGVIICLHLPDGIVSITLRKKFIEDACITLETPRSIELDGVILRTCLDSMLNNWEELIFEKEILVRSLLKYLTLENDENARRETLIPFLRCCGEDPVQAVDLFMKFNLMKPLISILKAFQNDERYLIEVEAIVEGMRALLRAADRLVGNEVLYNPIALQIGDNDGIVILEALQKKRELNATVLLILIKYFRSSWQEYLAKRRGLKLKKAQ